MIEALLEPWAVFAGFVIILFTIDLLFGHRGEDLRASIMWSAVWIGAGLAFGLWILAEQGREAATAYYAAYLLEKALSLDNIFVFVLIFSQLRIPAHQQHRVLILGVVSALVMRAVMIWGGVYLLARFHWFIYPFAALLFVAAARLLFAEKAERRFVEASCAACSTWIARIIPVTPLAHGQHFFVRDKGKLVATPMLVALILIETTDAIFAVDSIPAVLAITRDPYIVYTSNIFALFGLRALYFVLADFVQRFRFLRPGLAVVLCFAGCKMLLSDVIEIPVAASLFVVAGVLLVAIAASWALPREKVAN